MLTREEAKTKDCPHFYNHETKTYRKCVAEDCPKWRDSENLCLWCEQLKSNDKIVLISSCELCPDFGENGQTVIEDKNLLSELYFWHEYCNKCPHRYGYCGS